jgi:hypothetical protein
MPGDRALKSWRTSRSTTMCPFRIARNPIAALIGIIARNHRNGPLVSANVLGRIQHFHHRRRGLAGHDDGYLSWFALCGNMSPCKLCMGIDLDVAYGIASLGRPVASALASHSRVA